MDAQAFLSALLKALLPSPLLPFLGLAAALAFLPLPERTRNRLVPAVLALLWLGQAAALVRAWEVSSHPGVWALAFLALAQAVVLFAGGTVGGLLRFRPAGETRSVAGAALLLVILGAAAIGVLHRQAAPAGSISAEAFPLAGATLALFLLGALPRGSALWAAAIPVLWTATAWLGVIPTDGGRTAVTLAGFLAGFLLVWPEWDRDPDLVPGSRMVEELGRVSKMAWQIWLAVLALGLVLLAGELLPPAPRTGLHTSAEWAVVSARRALFQLALSLTVVVGFVTASWLRFPAWASPAFRSVAVGSSQVAGSLRRWAARGWHPAALIVAGGIALYVLLHEVLGWTGATVETGLRDRLILALVILIVLVLVAHWLRRRIFIAEIATPEAEAGETPDEWGKALAARLRNELGSLAALYRTIDEALPARQGRSMRLELAVEDVAGQLENTLGQEISVGSLAMKIPFSGVLSRILRLWRGPRLTGTLHREGPEAGGRLVLTADVSGGGRPASFRVTQDDLLECDRGADEQQKAYALVRQLAFRIVTAMASAGSPRWEAIQAFTTGLRAYRAVQRAGVNHELELRKAETYFLEALRLDEHFTDCHYNLAIVYNRLGDSAAAEAAFREAIAADPDNPAAHLGLTDIYCNKQDFLRAEIWARQAIVLSPNNVRAWNFVGVAGYLDQVAVRERKVQRTPEEVEAIWEGIVQSFRVAAALAWRDLCRKELTGALADRCEARRWVAMTFNNVAESCLEQRAACAGGAPAPAEGGPRGAPFLREGLRTERSKPYLHLALGKALAQAHLPVSAQAPPDRPGRREALEEALAALYFANDEGLDPSERCHRWMWILQVHCALHALGQSRPAAEKRRAREGVEKDHPEGMRRALRCFLDAVAPPQDLVLAATSQGADSRREDYLSELDKLERELGNLPPVPGQDRRFSPDNLKVLVAEARAIEQAPPSSRARPGGRRRLLPEDRGWVRAQRSIRQARSELGAEPPSSPSLIVRRLERAVGELSGRHQRQVDRQGLESLLARACLIATERLGRTATARDRRLRCLRKALEHATRGVASRPEDPVRRLILSQVHGALEDFEMAQREREAALNFAFPADLCGDRRLLAGLETEWRERLRVAGDARERRAALESADRFLERLLGIADNAPRPASGEPAAEGGATRFDHHAGIHLEAGKLAAAEGDWRRAIGHLRIAVASGHRLPESTPLLAKALGEIGQLERAADLLRHQGEE